MQAYKGFNKDMTCRDFQYKKGDTYTTNEAILCESGFHACENSLDCLSFYPPGNGCVYHAVELDGNIQRDRNGSTKCAATKIKIGARLSIAELVRNAIAFVFSKENPTHDQWTHAATSGYGAHATTSGFNAYATTSGDCACAVTSGDCACAVTSGDRAHAATSGRWAHAVTSGDRAHAATSGGCACAITSGDYAHAVTSGDQACAVTAGVGAHAVTAGDYAHAATSGRGAHAATSGYGANAVTSGGCAHAEVGDMESIAAVLGTRSRARGVLGCWLVLTERDLERHILGVLAVKVDGEKVRPGIWYELKNGEIVEA